MERKINGGRACPPDCPRRIFIDKYITILNIFPLFYLKWQYLSSSLSILFLFCYDDFG